MSVDFPLLHSSLNCGRLLVVGQEERTVYCPELGKETFLKEHPVLFVNALWSI